MNENLTKNLYTKHPLRFGEDGKFKILMMSDIQESLNWDERTLPAMDRLVEQVMPDLVILGGDNCDGHKLKTEEDLREYLKIFASPMEKRRIPWAHVFGNHDHDMGIDDGVKTQIYEECEYCVSKHTEGIGGTTNFVLPVQGSSGEEIAFALWGLDTNNHFTDVGITPDESFWKMKRAPNSSVWGIPAFDQLMWYWNSSAELEEHCGRKVDGMMVMHIAPWEFQYAVENPEIAGTVGSTVEHMDLGGFNSGVVSAVLQRGDIRCIACGHSHEDCFSGTLCGMTVCLDACAGYSPYGFDNLRGGRVFEIDERDTSKVVTYMMHYDEVIGICDSFYATLNKV